MLKLCFLFSNYNLGSFFNINFVLFLTASIALSPSCLHCFLSLWWPLLRTAMETKNLLKSKKSNNLFCWNIFFLIRIVIPKGLFLLFFFVIPILLSAFQAVNKQSCWIACLQSYNFYIGTNFKYSDLNILRNVFFLTLNSHPNTWSQPT